ncbi:hypothetical protein AX15_001414 [Amanita polypyramis BW_CC]|nr:hypothetical protein AX15_001414 [Amanita polypyramis BW_CC]
MLLLSQASNLIYSSRGRIDVGPDTRITVIPAMTSSGETSVRSALSLPSFFSFNNYSYVAATRRRIVFTLICPLISCVIDGVLPANLIRMSNILPNQFPNGTFLPVNSMIVETVKYYGISSNYSMLEQGYTPSVKCSPISLNNFNPQYQSSTGFLVASFACPGAASPTTQGIRIGTDESSLFAFACALSTGPSQVAATDNYYIYLMGYGRLYSNLAYHRCLVNSDVSLMNAQYGSPSSFYNLLGSNLLNATTAMWFGSVPRLGWEAVTMFLRQIYLSQGGGASTVGNIITSLYQNESGDSSNSLETIWLIDTNLTARASPDIPIDVDNSLNIPLRNMSGTFNTITMGIRQGRGIGHRIPLLAPTFVMVASIVIVIVTSVQKLETKIRNPSSKPPEESSYFDASNVLYLIAASAVGNLGIAPDYANSGVPSSEVVVWLGHCSAHSSNGTSATRDERRVGFAQV